LSHLLLFFFFQAEDGIRDLTVTGVQTCALPILRVDRDLRAVLEQAAAFKRATEGAFNVAVEPLMRVWGFHRHRASAPTAAELAEAREAVLAAVVELDGDGGRLPSAHTQLDFGAIGVGYGIDPAGELLRAPIGRAP